MKIGSVEIDFTALAALVSALTFAYATVKGKAMQKAAKSQTKETDNAKTENPGG